MLLQCARARPFGAGVDAVREGVPILGRHGVEDAEAPRPVDGGQTPRAIIGVVVVAVGVVADLQIVAH